MADLIAAGEVVERPASVAKELVENAIDAGATAVTVEIQHGGMTLIRVTDNGCGIAAEEAETAFLRHATSKISSEYDLEAIGTLGFRGEALAAVAAVSRVDLLTRPAQADMGFSLELEGGVVVSREEAGCPQGTTMVVRDLFYNTPARLKFMKRTRRRGPQSLPRYSGRPSPIRRSASASCGTGSRSSSPPGTGSSRARSTPCWAGTWPWACSR